MKILVLGGNGMIGHQLYKSWRDNHDVRVTLRKSLNEYEAYKVFRKNDVFENIEIKNIYLIENIINEFSPDVVVNAIGITKQNIENDYLITKKINSEFPHLLGELCNNKSIRLIHLSTDCVFSGKRGNYKINDIKDADDTYGISKAKGELELPNVLTIRKSTIGFELENKHGLLEWFLKQTGTVNGYTNAIFTGMTTRELAKKLLYIIECQKNLTGIWHLTGEKIDKYSLLKKIKKIFKLKNVNVIPFPKFRCDRSLNGEEITKAFSYKTPQWDDMLEELYANEINNYENS